MAVVTPLSAATTGAALGLTLIVAIGAQNAFVLRQGLRREHVGAIVAFCAASDAILMWAGVAGLAQLLGARPALAAWLTAGGAAFLTMYGLRALWRAARPAALQAAQDHGAISLASALAQTAAFTLLNPHVYLDTVVLVGSVGAQLGEQRWWFAAGAALSSVLWFTALGYGARLLAPVFARPRAWQVLDALIGVVMLVLAALLVQRAMA
ncbi:MAG: amino acid transporter [Rubrivivax sp.]|nr:amino acid transporter [Rubrivivax sp.]